MPRQTTWTTAHAAQPATMASRKTSSSASQSQPTLRSSQSPPTQQPPVCITHPTTGQLMAPGSKVWPYKFDDRKFGRVWIGPKETYPGEPKSSESSNDRKKEPSSSIKIAEQLSASTDFSINPSSSSLTNSDTSASTMANSKQTTSSTLDADLQSSLNRKKGAAARKQNQKSKANKNKKKIGNAPPRTGSQQLNTMRKDDSEVESSATNQAEATKRAVARKGRKGNTDSQYTDMLERQLRLRTSGKIEESYVITAGVNAGIMFGWTKADVLNVVERLEKAIADGRKEKPSARMMEVVGEMERFEFRGDLNDLRTIREHYKGEFYNGADSKAKEGQSKWRAPGLLMLIQAGINVAFLKVLGYAEDAKEPDKEEDGYFNEDVFDGKAALFFRVPSKVCTEEREYFRAISRLGTKGSVEKKMAAYPGIDRALNVEEKKRILSKVRDEVEGGVEIITIVAGLFRKMDLGANNGAREYAMETLADDGFLLLEHVYRKKKAAPILVGDEMVEEEEVEDGEEHEDDEENEESEEKKAERTSLVVTLRYRT